MLQENLDIKTLYYTVWKMDIHFDICSILHYICIIKY